jgi:hypothetical protein
VRNGKPILCISGHGRAGKDTAAEWFRDNTVLRFCGGSSWIGREYMARRLSQDLGRLVTPEEAFERRHEDRDKWYRYLNEYREGDPTRLLRDCLVSNDIICGPRDGCEVRAARAEGLFDLMVWIDRPVPVDPTVTFSIEDADVIVRNHTTIEDYYLRLARLARVLGVLVLR